MVVSCEAIFGLSVADGPDEGRIDVEGPHVLLRPGTARKFHYLSEKSHLVRGFSTDLFYGNDFHRYICREDALAEERLEGFDPLIPRSGNYRWHIGPFCWEVR